MNKTRNQRRIRRHRRVRKTISGTAERGRLAVFRSGAHIYAQIIDDSQGRVLAAASSLKLGNFDSGKDATRRIAQAQAVGKAIAEAAKEKGIGNVVFDRGGYRFHGRVAALAQAARESGLQF